MLNQLITVVRWKLIGTRRQRQTLESRTELINNQM